MWRSNQRAWVAQDLFKEWLFKVCTPSIKDYLDTNDLPLKALLLLQNAPGHTKDLKDNLLTNFPWLTVQFLPPNTTSLNQPMDQEAWSEVTQRHLNSSWGKLCPSSVQGDGGDQGDTPEIMDEILATARDLELEVNEDDIEELIMGHEDELTTEELQDILNEEHQETQRNVSPSEQEEDERGPMPTSAIKDLLKKWEGVKAMVLEWHPNQAHVSRVGDPYSDNAINYFQKILKKREKQSILDMFFNAP
ncbi:uncharacterized protein TNCV_2152911 [Trichonephila clavipes]|nr:uncharacterized protein TNCV_2152911 [Trichonephila clavipes]